MPLAAAASPPECTDCGCCCFSDDPHYIQVFEVDAERMDAATLERATVNHADKRFLRFEDGRCVNLAVTDSGVGCGIYAMRPDSCRWLERGSGECLRQWRAKGPALIASSRLRAAPLRASLAAVCTSGEGE